MKIEIRKITQFELSTMMLQVAAQEGWLYSEEDVEFYYNLKQNNIFVVLIDEQIAGCMLLHRAGTDSSKNNLCSIGLFLVKPIFRNLKIAGSPLWAYAIAQLEQDYSLSLNSVPSIIGLYEKKGFYSTEITTSHYTLTEKTYLPSNGIYSIKEIELLTLGNIDCLVDFNSNLYQENLSLVCELLNQWNNRQDAKILVYKENQKVKGYGVLTICHRETNEGEPQLSWRISPLYAQEPLIAKKLLQAILSYVFSNRGTRVEINSTQSENSSFAQTMCHFGFKKTGETLLMLQQKLYFSYVPKPKLAEIYATLPLEYPHEALTLSPY